MRVCKFYPLCLFCFASCTGQLPGSFRLAQLEQSFSSQQEVNTKIDLLWVVDNSASMDVSQQKLRQGFSGFSKKYLQPTWDIHVAVITTDTYLAHPAFTNYLNSLYPQTKSWISPYISGRLSSFVNPLSSPNLVNKLTGSFDSGVLFKELFPTWSSQYAKLLPGIHDGPIPALCSELMPYFLKGQTQCAIRDDQNKYSGTSHCLYPDTSKGETSETQCVNTVQNNTIHSGKAVLSTQPPAGVAADSIWVNQLIEDFMVNVSTGSAGQGSERGLGSVLQLLENNEKSETAFFRKNSLRGIIFVSDEEDQTMVIPENPSQDYSPSSNYKCDQASLESMNSGANISGSNGYCCSDPIKNCHYGQNGTSCLSKIIDGYSYTISLCPDEKLLIPVSDIKSKLDSFFLALDSNVSGDSNYFIVSIVPMTAQAIQDLQTQREKDDLAVGAYKNQAVDRGDRYLELGSLVGNQSLSMNIAEADYSPLLDTIGKTIISKKSTFYLNRAPTGVEDMIVKVLHSDGSETVISSDKFVIQGKSLVITDQNLVLSLKSTDKMVINYQPKTFF